MVTRPSSIVLPLSLISILSLCACKPTTAGGDDSEADLALRAADLSSCAAAPGNLLANPSFEGGGGSARNTGAPASSVPGWDGCCNLDGQGLTTTWQVGAQNQIARCGASAVSIASAASHGDVLNQVLTISDGAGRGFSLTGWALVQSAAAGAQLYVDLFDLPGNRVVAASPPLTQGSTEWIQLSAAGTLPAGAAPKVQVRLYSKGTLSALVDDITLILR